MTHEELHDLTMRELAEKARQVGIENVAHMHPEEMIEAIQEQQDVTTSTGTEVTTS